MEVAKGRMSDDDAWERHVQEMQDEWKEFKQRLSLSVIDLDGPTSAELNGDSQLRHELRLARDRVGRSEQERARWLVEFAKLSATRLGDGDWLNLEYEVLVFAAPAPGNSVEVV